MRWIRHLSGSIRVVPRESLSSLKDGSFYFRFKDANELI
jgi:hypothetical protein